MQVQTRPAPATAPRWIHSESGVCKINIDGVVSRDGIKGSFSAVARNHTRDYMSTSVLMIKGLSDPGVLDTIACPEGFRLRVTAFYPS